MEEKEINNAAKRETLIIGMGVSAGGLEALTAFFNSLPENAGMAFIILSHHAPEKENHLFYLLQERITTSLEVMKITGQTEIRQDHIYGIPPGKLLLVENDHLLLADLEKEHEPIITDLFLRSLAEEKEKYAGGIILSGPGSDGVDGMQAIKERGGITIAQDPEEARNPERPLHTIKAGAADKVLPVKKMAAELLRHKESLFNIKELTELKKSHEAVKRQRYQETLATLGLYALEQEELEMIMHRAIQQSCLNLNLKCAFIAEFNSGNNRLKIVADAGCGLKGIEIENDAKWDLGYAFKSDKPIKVTDHLLETRFDISPFMAGKGYSSSAYVAIKGTEEIHGVFCIHDKGKREFNKQDLHFIQAVANILGMAIEREKTKRRLKEINFHLREEMKQNRQYQKDLVKNNIVERWELGGYLHDNLGQMLASAKIIANDIENKLRESSIDISEEVTQLNEIIDGGIEGIRNLTHDIIPVDIEEEGVVYALHFLIRRTQKMYDVNCRLKMDNIITELKNREIATHLYNVIQEAMKNAVTHGKAGNILVTAGKSEDKLMLQITDDGTGISHAKKSNGRGLRIMKYRVELLGGIFDIEDLSDTDEELAGTRITVKVPLEDISKNA